MNNVADIINETEEKDKEFQLLKTLIITEHDAEPYKVLNSSFMFNISIHDSETLIEGQLITSVMLQDTELDELTSWRYKLKNVTIKDIHCDTQNNNIVYNFTATDYEIASVEDIEDGDMPNG